MLGNTHLSKSNATSESQESYFKSFDREVPVNHKPHKLGHHFDHDLSHDTKMKASQITNATHNDTHDHSRLE